MTMESLKNAIGVIAEKLDENKEYLIQLDQQNGDGDLGISMSSGIHAVQDYLASNGETDLGKTLNRCGDFFNEAAPSSLGTIIAFFFKGMAKSLKGKENCSVLELAEGMQAVGKIDHRFLGGCGGEAEGPGILYGFFLFRYLGLHPCISGEVFFLRVNAIVKGVLLAGILFL